MLRFYEILKEIFPLCPHSPFLQNCFTAGWRQLNPFSCWRACPPSWSPASGTKVAKIIAIGKNSFSPPLFKPVAFMPCQPHLVSEPSQAQSPSQESTLQDSVSSSPENYASFFLFVMRLKFINPDQ